MSTRKQGYLWIVVGVLLLLGASVCSLLVESEYFYEGKVVFETEAEYTAFKVAVGDTEVRINEMMVLSSEPPIVAEFIIEAPKSLDFQYGKKGGLPSGWPFNALLGAGGACLLIGLIVRVVLSD